MAPRHADAVVIGAGILGASTAHFLAKSGFGTVVLLERGTVCSGSTQYSSAVVRQHYSNDVTIELAVRALKMFKQSEEELGGHTGFTQCGYLVLAAHGQEDATIRRNVPLQQSHGVETEILSPEQIKGLYPELDVSGVALGALEHESGYANPRQTVLSLVQSAADRWNLKVCEDTEVVDIKVEDDRVVGVSTTDGQIATPVVVNCAGAWAARVGGMVGISYSLAISREHVAVFDVPTQLEGLPLVADTPNRLYFRPEGRGRLHVGRTYPKDQEPCDPDTHDDRADPEVVHGMAERLVDRVPLLAETLFSDNYGGNLVRSFSGVYEISDDWHPIVGPSDTVEGYFAAVGGSGHSFKIGPAIGEALAEVIVGREPGIDLTPLGHTRFAEEAPLLSAWGPGSRG